MVAALVAHTKLTLFSHKVVAALVAHAGSPQQRELDLALCVLTAISDTEARTRNPSATAKKKSSASTVSTSSTTTAFDNRGSSELTLKDFAPFLKMLLEDVRRLSYPQQRMLFQLVFHCTGFLTQY